MNRVELQKVIDLLESSNSKDEALFGVFQYGGGPDESFIRANKQGLELFAAEILKASRDADQIAGLKNKNAIPLDREEWIEGDTIVHFIEPTLDKRKKAKHETYHEPYKEGWQDMATKFGCFVVLIAGIVSFIVGLITIVTWIF